MIFHFSRLFCLCWVSERFFHFSLSLSLLSFSLSLSLSVCEYWQRSTAFTWPKRSTFIYLDCMRVASPKALSLACTFTKIQQYLLILVKDKRLCILPTNSLTLKSGRYVFVIATVNMHLYACICVCVVFCALFYVPLFFTSFVFFFCSFSPLPFLLSCHFCVSLCRQNACFSSEIFVPHRHISHQKQHNNHSIPKWSSRTGGEKKGNKRRSNKHENILSTS